MTPAVGPGVAAPTATSLPALPDNNAAIHSCPTVSAYSQASPPAAADGVVSGRISFERVPFSAQLGAGLDYAATAALPARGVVIEAVAPASTGPCSGAVVATALTDGDGWYRLDAGSAAVCIRARAQLYRAADAASAARWNVVVADNTNDDSVFLLQEGAAASAAQAPRRDLHAATGWSGGSYQGARAAAPFAILDTACKALNATLAGLPAARFPPLKVFWSTNNTSDDNGTLAAGKIGGPFFSPNAAAIYLRGDAAVDTDEFDETVIAHEFAHFVTQAFARSDSIGGDHSLLDILDPRVAFEEGWATAFAGLVLHTHHYRDSNQLTSASGYAREFHFNMQSTFASLPVGWYSEASVQRALFNIAADSSFSGLGLGLDSLLQTFASAAYRDGAALASVFSYASALKNDNAAQAFAIAQVFNDEAMNGDAVEPFAGAETNALDADDLPVYADIVAGGGPVTVCSDNDYGRINTLSNRRYLRFDAASAGKYRFSVEPQALAGVAGFELIARGATTASAMGAAGTLAQRSVHYTTPAPLSAATHVLSVFHVGNVAEDTAVPASRQCFAVSVTQVP